MTDAATTTMRCCAHTTTALGPDAALSLDDVREGVRRQSFFGVMMAIVSSMLVERTERGDEMFMTMLARHAQHVLDSDALACLPEPAATEAAAAVCRGRGRAHARCGAAVERELVCRLRRRAAGRRRLVPARFDSQSEHRVGQRAAVRARHSHDRTSTTSRPRSPMISASSVQTQSNSPIRRSNRCGPITSACVVAARHTTILPRCCGTSRDDSSTCRWS